MLKKFRCQLLSVFLLLWSCGLLGTVAAKEPSQLDLFFASEFGKVSTKLDTHIRLLDMCLDEMDRFEIGDIGMKLDACPKYNAINSESAAIFQDSKLLLTHYGQWLSSIPSDSEIELSTAAQDKFNTLVRIYLVKRQQATAQTERVQKIEKELVDRTRQVIQQLEAKPTP